MVIMESLIKNDNFGGYKYKYYYRMVKSNICLSSSPDENIKIQCYGIEIERQDVVNESVVNIQRNCVKIISPYRHKVHNCLKKLFENNVSPIHLVDVIGEYVDQCVDDFKEVNFKEALNCN